MGFLLPSLLGEGTALRLRLGSSHLKVREDENELRDELARVETGDRDSSRYPQEAAAAVGRSTNTEAARETHASGSAGRSKEMAEIELERSEMRD